MLATAKEDYRQLSASDFHELNELLLGATSLLKETYQRTSESSNNMLEGPNMRAYGVFRDGRLAGVVGVRLWISLPYFSLVNMVYRMDDVSVVERARSLNGLLEVILRQLHSEGRFTFFIATLVRARQLKIFRHTGRIVHSKYFAVMDGYDISVEAIVKPGEESPFRTLHELLGNRSHQHLVWIRRYTLPNQQQNSYRDWDPK